MDAIELLESQHREVEELFDEYEELGDKAFASRRRIFQQLADNLAVHCDIEEKIFYPASVSARTEDLLREAVEEHLAAKRILADLLEMEPSDDSYDAKMAVLKEQLEHHIEEEEGDLFDKARKLLGAERLDELGDEMQARADELMEEGEPRTNLPAQTDEAAPIS